jgi:predicted aconitase
LVDVRLNDEEQAMRAGVFGEPRRWAIEHQIAVGEFFDAIDPVPVSQTHIMADTEALGETGVRFLEGLTAAASRRQPVGRPVRSAGRTRKWSSFWGC